MKTRKPKTRVYTVGIDKVYFAVPPKLPPGVTVADEVRVRATGRTDAAQKGLGPIPPAMAAIVATGYQDLALRQRPDGWRWRQVDLASAHLRHGGAAMKMQDVVIGGRYTAKVSGRIQVVRVVEIKEIPPASWSRSDAWRKLIYAVNEATGKRTTIRSAQRLRSRVDNGCEFCRQNFNRPPEGFTCPYCRKVWAAQEATT